MGNTKFSLCTSVSLCLCVEKNFAIFDAGLIGAFFNRETQRHRGTQSYLGGSVIPQTDQVGRNMLAVPVWMDGECRTYRGCL